MRIGALAQVCGVSRDTIRFYEREGLITSLPSQTAANTYREYPVDLVERLAMIGEAREAGLPLADLRILLDAVEGRGEEELDVNEFLDTRIAQVEESIRQSRRFLKTLRATRDALAAAVTIEDIEPY